MIVESARIRQLEETVKALQDTIQAQQNQIRELTSVKSRFITRTDHMQTISEQKIKSSTLERKNAELDKKTQSALSNPVQGGTLR